MDHDQKQSDISLLQQGKTPESGEALQEITCGIDFLTDFLEKQYLKNYIPAGGRKLKFVTGRPGAGKTHFSQYLKMLAEKAGYLTVSFSARSVWIHDFREVYLEILRQCDLEHVLQLCADHIITQLGEDPGMVENGRTFMDALSDQGKADALTKSTLRESLRDFFIRNPVLDNNFALACSLLTGNILGHPVLDPAGQKLLLDYMYGSREVKLAQLRSLGLAPDRITKFNARNMLRSLAEIVHQSGCPGIFIVIDDMEVLCSKAGYDQIRYTRLKREDAYESIRQLIDDIDNMRYLMFLLCFDRELMDNESIGLKSYQALWMRIQNEVMGTQFNRFADIIDLDRLAGQVYTPEVLCTMAEKYLRFISGGTTGGDHLAGSEGNAKTADGELTPRSGLSLEQAAELTEKAEYGSVGLPYLLGRTLLEGGFDHV